MVPIREGKNPFFVIVSFEGRLGIVDDKCSTETIRILATLVRMVPVCARLVNLRLSALVSRKARSERLYSKIVHKGLAGGNCTLSHSSCPIHLVGTVHVETVKMQACGLVAE